MTALNVMMTKLKDLSKKVRNSSYFVKRGAINWSSFPFNEHPKAISIMIDDMGYMDPNGMNSVSISLEIASKMPTSDTIEIDDTLMEEMVQDATWISNELIQAKDSDDNPVVFKFDKPSAQIIEFHDSSFEVQGLVVTFNTVF